MDRYLNDRDHLLTGKPPPPAQNTVADLLNRFLGEKKDSMDEGDITESTFQDYERTCVRINDHFGKQCNLDSLTTDDFKNLRKALAKGISPVTLKRRLTIARMVFSNVAAVEKALKSPLLSGLSCTYLWSSAQGAFYFLGYSICYRERDIPGLERRLRNTT